jgi:DNA polymerase-3 subunit epsilon/ATP-dependent DNA helicase DinG
VGHDVAALVAHNAGFDFGFLEAAGIHLHRPILDTFELAGILLPGMASYSLGQLCRHLDIPLLAAHRALDDAEATGHLFVRLLERLHTLPAHVISTVLAHGRAGDWTAIQLFEDTAAARGLTSQPAPRTDQTRDDFQGMPAHVDADQPIGLDGAPVEPVDPARLDALLGADGALHARMGDAYEVRPGQLEMARQVMDAFNRDDHLLVEAGTGVGKSLAYLAPAALWSLRNQRQVVVATYTLALQNQLVEKDLPQLRDLLHDRGYGELTWAQLKGRGNYLCMRRLQQWLDGRVLTDRELSFLAKVLVWLTVTADGDVGGLFLPAPAERALWDEIASDGATCTHGRCRARPGWRDFYLEARSRAERVHCLVVNHALLMADVAANHRILPPYARLVVDEAHHLEDAATDQLTYRVDWPRLQRQLARLTAGGDLLPALLTLLQARQDSPGVETLADIEQRARRTASVLNRFAQTIQAFALEQNGVRKASDYAQRLAIDGAMRSQPLWSEVEIDWDQASDYLKGTLAHLHRLVQRLEQAGWPAQEPEATLFDTLRGVTGELGDLNAHMETIVFGPRPGAPAASVAWLEVGDNRRAGNQVTLYAAPLHVGDRVENGILHRCRTTVFTGATLRTAGGFDFLRERLGLWDASASTVESPFDFQRSALLYLPTNLPAPNQPGYQQGVEDAILDAALTAGGRTMALFTSYAQLRTTADALRAPLDRAGITLLQHGASSRNRLLQEYRTTDRAVLLGTRSFWEGIDLPGEQLSVLCIVRLPFAVPSDPLIAARSAEFDNAFRDFTVPDAILRFRQGFGRLIRRKSDRGVVVLLDSRLWQKSYGQSFLDALPECTQRHAPLEDLGSEIDLWLNRERIEPQP